MAEEKKTKAAPKKAAPKKEEAKPEETKAETKTEAGAKASEAAQKAYGATSEAAKVAYDATRDAAMSAFKAATVVVTDPMGGQSKAMKSLGDKGSLAAGIFFVALYVVLGYLFSMGGSFGNHIRLIGYWLLTPATICGCFFGLGFVLKQKVSIFESIFSTGVTVFPMVVGIVLTGLGIFTGWIDGLIITYCFAIVILLVGGFLQDVLKANTQQAVLLAPAIIVAVQIIKYIYGQIFGGMGMFFGIL